MDGDFLTVCRFWSREFVTNLWTKEKSNLTRHFRISEFLGPGNTKTCRHRWLICFPKSKLHHRPWGITGGVKFLIVGQLVLFDLTFMLTCNVFITREEITTRIINNGIRIFRTNGGFERVFMIICYNCDDNLVFLWNYSVNSSLIYCFVEEFVTMYINME